MNEAYVDTVRLLLDVTAPIFSSGRFAMKGGTALNLFVQDMPRLSVDIDLVLTDSVLDRDGALEIISTDLAAIRTALKQMGHHANLPPNEQGDEVKLQVSNGTALVKVEVNVVFRGTVLPVEQRSLVPLAQELFTTDAQVPVLAIPELYGSKLVAAMDRQHPRDMFDVLYMLDRFGWEQSFTDCFAGHPDADPSALAG